MYRQTKFCQLSVHLQGGVRVDGKFHIEASTSSTVRPSDALRDLKGDFLLLSDALLHEGGQETPKATLMIRGDAIVYVELPRNWTQE